MKALIKFSILKRSSIFAAAVSVAATVAFVATASAEEKKFDALGGVTAEVLAPVAMDAVQGAGSIRIGFINVSHPVDIVPLRSTGGPWDIVIHLETNGSGRIDRTRAE